MLKLQIAKFGFYLWDRDILPKTGKILFEYGENEYAEYQLKELKKSFSIMKRSPEWEVDVKNLERIVGFKLTLENVIRNKEISMEEAKKYKLEELDIHSRSGYYMDILNVERSILKWISQREQDILELYKDSK